MKNVLHNRLEKPEFRNRRSLTCRAWLWGCKGLLTIVLSGCTVLSFAQNVEVNRGTAYTIASTVDASGASTYQWLENGQVISGATGASYVVPNTKAAGVYRYIRQAKSADCSDWQSSNEFTVSVVGPASTGVLAPYIDPRDGKEYQTVLMPDGKVWFAQNLNYTKDLYYNTASNVANSSAFTTTTNGVPAIGSYWCPPTYAGTPTASGSRGACDVYGALYTWETAMMVDGKYADEAKTSSTWNESWVSSYYFATGTAPGSGNNANRNNARGGRGICPPGWHVPTDYEWAYMLNRVEGNSTYTAQTVTGWWGSTVTTVSAAVKLKSRAIYTDTDPGDGSWLNHANRGSNTFGFGIVPAGYRLNSGVQFFERGNYILYWSSSVNSSDRAWNRAFDLTARVLRHNFGRSYGFSVRCVKN